MSTRLIISILFLSRFEKVKIGFFVYIHIILAKKFMGLVLFSGDIESCEITSPNIPSTLNFKVSIISFHLSM